MTNVNSPRRVDEEILDNIMVMARHGQCVAITPFTLMGAMAPVTLAGALVQQTAEALCVVALCQMIRPGTPCVIGSFTSNVDMRTGSPAFGTPEYVNAVLASAQIGRRLKIPVRTSAVNASPVVDAQSTYETGFSLQAAILSHSHLINHAAGWLEGGLSASLEKIVVDAEMLRNWAECLKPIEFSDDDIAVEAIKSVAPGGHFFGESHTLARYESAFYRPILSDWSNFENWTEAGARNATERATGIWKKMLADYVASAARPGSQGGRRSLRRTPHRASSRTRDDKDHERPHVCGHSRPSKARGGRCSSTSRATAGVPLSYVPYPAPQTLEDLWLAPGSWLRIHVRLPDCAGARAGRADRRADSARRVGCRPAVLSLGPDRAGPIRLTGPSRTRSVVAPAGPSSTRTPASMRSAIICSRIAPANGRRSIAR